MGELKMGSSFEILYEEDLRRYFDSEKYTSQEKILGSEKRDIQEAVCKSFIYGLSQELQFSISLVLWLGSSKLS